MKKYWIWIVYGVLVLGSYYLFTPTLNPTSLIFWFYLSVVVFVGVLFALPSHSHTEGNQLHIDSKNLLRIPLAVIVCWAVIFVGMLIGGPLFNAREYSDRIQISVGNFEEDVKPADFTNLPLLDKDSSQKLGDRIVGQLPDLVSQFRVSEEYTQINYHGKIVRVTPLEHNGFFKYWANGSSGTPGYVVVNSTDGSSELVRLEDKGLHYMPSSWFGKNLKRHVQMNNPFLIFGEESFEIDEEGNPYWVIQIIEYKFVGLKKEVAGVMVVDPCTGDMTRYDRDEIPSWIDNVYDAELITDQVNDWGAYKSGFLNAQFSQKNVTQVTEGYTYLTLDDDVFMYTGITSVANDESNIGFVLVNLRTKETTFYEIPGAEEYSAMDSAKGQVQEKNYTSTFPLLINFNNKPTYLLSLKDAAGLVKMYAFVDVQDYQKVTVTDASYGIEAAANAYAGKSITESTIEPESLKSVTFTVNTVQTAVIDGTTYYYFTDTEGNKYRACISTAELMLPFIQEGDLLKAKVIEGEVSLIVEIR